MKIYHNAQHFNIYPELKLDNINYLVNINQIKTKLG